MFLRTESAPETKKKTTDESMADGNDTDNRYIMHSKAGYISEKDHPKTAINLHHMWW